MKKKILANGVEMPYVGLGVYKVPAEECVRVVKDAIDAGYTHIDTAKVYRNEREVGIAVRDHADRDKIFVTSKVWNDDQGYDATLRAFDESMGKLGFEYLDLYLIHWARPQSNETWRAMERLYREGRVRAIGVSNFEPQHLEMLARTAEIAPMVDQVELHPLLTQKALREYCAERGIAVEAWSPLMHGERVTELDTVKALAAKYGKSAAQIILRWDIQSDIITIPKSVNVGRMKENADIFDFELSPEDMAAMDALDRGIRRGDDPNVMFAR